MQLSHQCQQEVLNKLNGHSVHILFQSHKIRSGKYRLQTAALELAALAPLPGVPDGAARLPATRRMVPQRTGRPLLALPLAPVTGPQLSRRRGSGLSFANVVSGILLRVNIWLSCFLVIFLLNHPPKVQGDISIRTKPIVDMKTKVVF